MSDFAALQDAARRLKPEIAIVLGSGLADALPTYQDDTQVAFADLPGMAAPTVVGHGGSVDRKSVV